MSDKIYAMLEETNRLLDNYGHVPDTSLVLYDMDDELKECVVSQHSERLAIAFGLISTKPGTPIRIMKNLRVYIDYTVSAISEDELALTVPEDELASNVPEDELASAVSEDLSEKSDGHFIKVILELPGNLARRLFPS
nr:pentatricopeptide repeat-containing protein At1g08070, chloroplastic [Tanacetum cinerariifolium]